MDVMFQQELKNSKLTLLVGGKDGGEEAGEGGPQRSAQRQHVLLHQRQQLTFHLDEFWFFLV